MAMETTFAAKIVIRPANIRHRYAEWHQQRFTGAWNLLFHSASVLNVKQSGHHD